MHVRVWRDKACFYFWSTGHYIQEEWLIRRIKKKQSDQSAADVNVDYEVKIYYNFYSCNQV